MTKIGSALTGKKEMSDKVDDFDFAEWIKGELDRLNWNQSDLADEAGLTRAAISKYVHRQMQPTIYTFQKILKAVWKRMEIRGEADDVLRIMFKRCIVMTRGKMCMSCKLREKCERFRRETNG